MGQSLSKTMIIGNLGGDPDLRYTAGGSPIAKFSVATSDTWKDKATGQQVERTEWHRVVVFGSLAEIAGKFGVKGSKVYVEGRNQTREWEKDGVKRSTTEIIVDQRGQIQFLDPRPAAAGDTNQKPASQPTAQPRPASGAMPDYPPYDEDIPFCGIRGLV